MKLTDLSEGQTIKAHGTTALVLSIDDDKGVVVIQPEGSDAEIPVSADGILAEWEDAG